MIDGYRLQVEDFLLSQNDQFHGLCELTFFNPAAIYAAGYIFSIKINFMTNFTIMFINS